MILNKIPKRLENNSIHEIKNGKYYNFVTFKKTLYKHKKYVQILYVIYKKRKN